MSSLYFDPSTEYRLLATIIDDPDSVLRYNENIFTDHRPRLFNAMKQAYLVYGNITTEGVERFYGAMVPPELEASRGGIKASAVLDKLIDFATRRQVAILIDSLAGELGTQTLDRVAIGKKLALPALIAQEDSSLGPGVTRFVSDLMHKKDGNYRFVRTGLPFLDHMLGGEWPRQALTVIMGQSGGGKTGLTVQSILNMARMGLPSLFISLEMPKDRIISRMVANIAQVDGMKLRMGDITDEEQVRVDAALEEIQSLEEYIFIVDKPGLNVDEIIYQVRVHKETHGIESFFVDYIQIVDRPGSEQKGDVEALGHVAQQLRNTAVNLDIAAICLSQKNGQDGLQSVWGSRRIVHISDSIFEIEIDAASTDAQRMCRLNFLKNRDGAVGEANCIFIPRHVQFL